MIDREGLSLADGSEGISEGLLVGTLLLAVEHEGHVVAGADRSPGGIVERVGDDEEVCRPLSEGRRRLGDEQVIPALPVLRVLGVIANGQPSRRTSLGRAGVDVDEPEGRVGGSVIVAAAHERGGIDRAAEMDGDASHGGESILLVQLVDDRGIGGRQRIAGGIGRDREAPAGGRSAIGLGVAVGGEGGELGGALRAIEHARGRGGPLVRPGRRALRGLLGAAGENEKRQQQRLAHRLLRSEMVRRG
ncbi:MAG: hypothetical protein QM820_44495 [Minicystis sp.]